MHVLKAEGLVKEYRKRKVVNNVNLELKQGEMEAIRQTADEISAAVT